MTDIQAVAVPDTSHYIGVKVNGIVYVKLEDARKLREGWDAADKRIAELEAKVAGTRRAALEEVISLLDEVAEGEIEKASEPKLPKGIFMLALGIAKIRALMEKKDD